MKFERAASDNAKPSIPLTLGESRVTIEKFDDETQEWVLFRRIVVESVDDIKIADEIVVFEATQPGDEYRDYIVGPRRCTIEITEVPHVNTLIERVTERVKERSSA